MSRTEHRLLNPHTSRDGRRLAAVLVVLAAVPIAHACGPFFPNQVIANGDAGLLALPAGDFAAEVDRLRPPGEPPFAAQASADPYRQSANADVADLNAALADLPPERRAAAVGQYRHMREQLTAHLKAWAGKSGPAPGPPYADLPTGLPGEFADYIHGLLAFDDQDLPAARQAWQALLARPAEQRHYRSTWAAYMLGRSYLATDPAAAAEWFARTRQLARAGFADPIGLAAAGLGWEAHGELTAHRFVPAMRLYLPQLSSGDPTAAMSLRDTVKAVLAAGPDALVSAARDDTARRVVTAYLLSSGGPSAELCAGERQQVLSWLAAVRAAAVTDVAGADRLAWAAYRAGDFAAAADWVARAPAGSAIAEWVRAKLLLRDGKVDQAAAVLGGVVRAFPPDASPAGPLVEGDDEPDYSPVPAARPMMSDLAVLQLARGQYVDSLRLLRGAGRWLDAAYVAERVLSADELRAYVDRHEPADGKNGSVDLRCLLARRLTRLGRWRDARRYFTPDLQEALDAYVAGLDGGRDATRPAADRAKSYLAAARLARTQGMDLLGTELDPDYHFWEGNFEFGGAEQARGAKDTLARPTADELARWKANGPADDRRWHYRYVAADHAWSAAALMSDGSADTAAVLYEAGCWLKDRDPQAAQRFYKALTKRCPKTDLGKRAIAAHWFPKNPV